MENTMVVSTPQETQISQPVTSRVPDVSLDPMDFQKEINKIAAEQGSKIENGNVVPLVQETKQPEQAVTQPQVEAVPKPVPVPPKFQTQDGNIDIEKVQKATFDAKQALERYAEMEKEISRKRNELNKLQTQPPPAAAPQTYAQPYQQPYPQQPQLTPDLINQAIAKNGAGPVLLELQQLTFNAATEQARTFYEGQIQELRNRVEAKDRASELQTIADIDPWVYTEEGIKTLGNVRQQKPWLNNAPEPWLESYKAYKAEQFLRSTPSVQTPNPMAPQRAPATPVGAGNRSTPQTPSFAVLSQDKRMMDSMLNNMSPEQQNQFWEQAFKAGGLK